MDSVLTVEYGLGVRDFSPNDKARTGNSMHRPMSFVSSVIWTAFASLEKPLVGIEHRVKDTCHLRAAEEFCLATRSFFHDNHIADTTTACGTMLNFDTSTRFHAKG
ncbi:hypothetical protein O6H91_18G022300 [Diphasiastrum complanatum]|uniref:Uncharacterized protein n=1 Tax=Diphasiastrum complanatum TaxID=34168 RepID=A0ACC2AYU4_DIPCM|nr:hypothetical protein O6H91_18G022300 [Diphasiastrum complanatum]